MYKHHATMVVTVFAVLLGVYPECCFAERPTITRVEADNIPGWDSYIAEARSSIAKLIPREIEGRAIQVKQIEPMLLGVIHIPLTPIERYGAAISEILLLHISAEDDKGSKILFIAVAGRFPFQDRQWFINEILSSDHAAPPLSSIFLLSSDDKKREGLLKYIKRIFDPGVCIGSQDLVINTVIFEKSLIEVFGRNFNDREIQLLTTGQ